MARANGGKVIWAVDANASDKKTQVATFKALASITAGSGESIEPVCVLSPDQLRVPTAAFTDKSKEYQLEAETLLKKWVKELKNPRLTAPTLLAQNMYSANQSIDTLLKYAKESEAALIGVGTRTKKAWERFLVGSFADSMILKSSVPLLVVNEKNYKVGKTTSILFPTDFSAASELAFNSLLPIAKGLKAKIHLYYKFDYVTQETAPLLTLSLEYSRYIAQDIEARRNQATEWQLRAIRSGVKMNFILDDKPSYIVDGILKAAKKTKVNLIAMASNSSGLALAVMGSVARQVVRASPTPVWVLHPTKVELATQAEAKRTSPPPFKAPVAA